MSGIQPFDFQGVAVRVAEIDGQLLWVARDVGNALELADVRTTLRSFTAKEKGRHSVPTLGGEQKMMMVTEQGLYRLIFQSRKKSAKAFQTWVFSEVLPAIRKTGKYAVDPELDELPGDEVPRSTILDFLSRQSRLTFEEICCYGAKVRRLNQSLGISYEYIHDPALGRVRTYSSEVLHLAWHIFDQSRIGYRQPELPLVPVDPNTAAG